MGRSARRGSGDVNAFLSIANQPQLGTTRQVEDLWNDVYAATTAGTAVTYRVASGVSQALGGYARSWFATMDPGWPTRFEQLTEFHLLVPLTALGVSVRDLEAPPRPMHENLSVPTLVAGIRASLGLNVTETARVLGVERPTVYAWLANRSRPQRANWTRLIRLHDLALAWQYRSPLPIGDAMRLVDIDGKSIVDLLAQDPLPVGLIQERMRTAAEAASNLEGGGVRRPSVRESARRHGLSTSATEDSGRRLDWLTKRPFGSEDE